MKIKAFFLCLFLAPLLTNAQNLFFGIKGGLNISNINNDKDNHAKLGGHGGAYFGLKFNEKMGASVELLYSMKGTHHYGDVLVPGPGPGPYVVRRDDIMVFIDYIDFPLLFNYYFTPALSAHAGLNFNVPVRGVRRYADGRPDEDFLPFIYKNVLSFPLGATLDIGQVVNVGLRADIGLSPIGGDMRKNNVFMASIGFTLFRKDANLKNFGKSKSSKK